MKFFKLITWLIILPLCLRAQNGVYYIPSNKEADSVRAVLANTSNDSLKMFIYYDLSSYYTELNKDTSLYYAELQLQSAKNLQQPLWQADALFQIAYITYGLGNYPKSLDAITKGLAITTDEKSETNNWRVTAFSEDGNSYKARLFIEAALHQIFGFLYENTDDNPKAISQYLSAINLAKVIDNKTELSLDYMNLGDLYIGLNELDSALVIENKSRMYAIESGYKIYMGTILESIGDIYFIKENYDSAGKYYSEALKEAINQFNLKDVINANLSLAKLWRTKGEADSSLSYARNALGTSRSLGLLSGSRRSYNALFAAYKILNNKDSAFAYLKLAKYLGDSLDNIQNEKVNQYQRQNLNNQLQLQETEKAKIQYQNAVKIYSLLAGIAALLVFAFLLFRNNRNRKKANELLRNQKEEIELQKKNAEESLSQLKSTQAQLIQSEKMASLGELTAGIAHEIQNPLNFVNNFSDINKELVDELQTEIKSGNKAEAISISNDIKENEEKINHHGKRAGDIVKGMLQHSRSSTGVKEPTDINALADEYLRLSYHGLRAKDKTFNAKMETYFDESIGKINIIPQDIGRVLLNLYNNAFYAVSERLRQAQPDNHYEPIVLVTTRKIGNHVLITVSDNGSGIPQKIVDKIFQPFFTTKPTGQGTGLGLSLSYDIVKAHGGEIKVDTKEGEARPDDPVGRGSTFIIQLPVA